MDSDEPIIISLTGTASHTANPSPSQGSFSIGVAGMDKKKVDVLVEDDLPINWNAFDEFRTPAGGYWPRVFHYWGNDIGFIEWSIKRPIEGFFWYPSKPFSIDLSKAQIASFSIQATDEHALNIVLGTEDRNKSFTLQNLNLSGNLEQVELVTAGAIPSLRLNPHTQQKQSATPYKLPNFNALRTITSLDITVEPLGQAFDCESLLQFPELKTLNLTGNIANANCLEGLKNIERLGIRYSPHLENFPPLSSWNNLIGFIGWNIDEKTGKRLNAELKLLAKTKTLDYSSVTQLRSSIWFTTEYGIPFTNWESKSGKIATKAYKATLKEISKAKTEGEVKALIVQLLETINDLPNIETEEREDTWTAMNQLIEASPLDIPHQTRNNWFDETRKF